CCQSPRAYVLRPLPRRAGRPSRVGASSRPRGLRPSRGDSALAIFPFEACCKPARGGSLSPGLRLIRPPRHLPGSYQGLPTPPWAGLSPAALIRLSRRTLELRILALNQGFGNVARRQTSALR